MDDDTREFMQVCLKGVEDRIESLRDQVNLMVDHTQRATDLMRDNLEKRLEHLEENNRELRTFKDRLEGKASQQSVYIAWVLAAAGIGVSVASLFR